MLEVNLNNGKFIKSNGTGPMKDFIEKSVGNFFTELSRYINDNNDPGIFHYANEMTMASLFVCGNVRNGGDITAVQEYGTYCNRNNQLVYGRPDIFIKSGTDAIWVESKYERNLTVLGDDHWDLDAWLLWDKQNAFAQVETYYNSEKETINDCYKKHYLLTLCFKLIKEDAIQHSKKVEEKIANQTDKNFDRTWYYQVGFMDPDTDGKSIGIEVYGTCYDANPSVENVS